MNFLPTFEPFLNTDPSKKMTSDMPLSKLSPSTSDFLSETQGNFASVFQSIQDKITEKMDSMGFHSLSQSKRLMPLSNAPLNSATVQHPSFPIQNTQEITPSLSINKISHLLDHILEVAEHFVSFLGHSEFDTKRLQKLKEKRNLLHDQLNSSSINTYSVSALAISYSKVSYSDSNYQVNFSTENLQLTAVMTSYSNLQKQTDHSHMLNDLLFYQLDQISEDNFEDMASKYLPLLSTLLPSDIKPESESSSTPTTAITDPNEVNIS
tara:strand:- start:84 stop:881 length:798 start_codon:yes stop_codon:yes gene_type:complete